MSTPLAGSVVSLATGSEVDLAAGAEVALVAGTAVGLSAGAEVALVAGTSVTIEGTQDGGTVVPVPVTSDGHLEVAIHEPASVFGEVRTVEPIPRVQIDAVYGLLITDTETFTDGASGSATGTSSMFQCTTGVTIGGYGVVRSRRLLRYNPGQGVVVRFTTRIPTAGVANCLVMGGAFNAEDGLFVGYYGTAFGAMRRIAGTAMIVRLTVTVGSGGAETLTVTLNGVAFTVATGGVLATTGVAEIIAERVGGYTGWSSAVSPTSNGATVTFLQGTPAVANGAFTLTSTGTAAGTFATLRSGTANDSDTGFVAQTAWNVDRMNGLGGALNPSNVLLDPTKLNVWEFRFGYLGASVIELRCMMPDGEMNTVHQFQLPNTLIIPSFRNPCLRLGWVAASLGSTTALTIQGASASGLIDGQLRSVRDPYSWLNGSFAAGTTEYVALVIRSRGEFASVPNLRETEISAIIVGCETTNRLLTARLVLNPVMTGTVNWQYVAQTESHMEYATPTNVAATNGRQLAFLITGTSSDRDLALRDIRLEPGDTLALCVATVSGAATAAVGISWQER